jgi:hypothetical protein
MEPTNTEINNTVESAAPLNEAAVVLPTSGANFSEQVPEEVKQENFFDRNITFITFMFCIAIFPFSIIINVLLGAFNFRNKRDEIFRGIGYFFLVLLVLGLVGFGLCMLMISGIVHNYRP